MKRYRFLLLAFFLANNVHAEGLISGIAPVVSGAPKLANVNSNPDLRSPTINNTVPDTSAGKARAADIKRTSPRNTAEVGNTVEPVVSGSRSNNVNGTKSAQATGTTKTSSNGMSCKTYEGKTYDQGEAGYSDCMRNIRTDRQGTRTVP